VHFEVTSLREDVETDGRRAIVKFGRDFEADALRRDFTINALSVDARGKLHDYVGGLSDLAARRVRFIGDPQQRIEEDFLRILRFFRFSAAYGAGQLDAAGLQACIRARAGLGFLSRERIGAEMLKLLVAANAPFVVQVMAQAGLLAFLRAAPWPERLRNMTALTQARQSPDPLLALAALALHHEGDAERLAEALRLSNAQQRRLRLMAQCAAPWHGAQAAPDIAALRQASFLFRPQAARDGLALALAESRCAPDDAAFAAADAFLRDNLPPQPPFSGGDLLARGVLQGSALGGALKRLQALWIRAGFPQDPKIVAQLIDKACRLD
jgi:tRNA nucleotidyltransferase/poly(A) polymerase